MKKIFIVGSPPPHLRTFLIIAVFETNSAGTAEWILDVNFLVPNKKHKSLRVLFLNTNMFTNMSSPLINFLIENLNDFWTKLRVVLELDS